MWAEITIRTKSDLPTNLRTALEERLQLAGNLDQAYDSTSLRDTPDFSHSVEFWHYSSSYVYLIFRSDARTLKVHVETTLTKTDLNALIKNLGEVHDTLTSFLEFRNIKPLDNYIIVSAEGDYILRGARHSVINTIKKNLLDNVLVEILIPLLTFGLSLLRGFMLIDGIFTVLIAMLAVFIWAFANAYGHSKDYEFEGL